MFAGLSRRQRRRVERCFTFVELPAGHRLWTEGDPGREFVVVVRGQLGVAGVGGHASVIGRGGHVGELALLDKNERTRRASVSVLEPSVVAVATRFEFATLLDLDNSLPRRILGAAVRREADVLRRRTETAQPVAV